MSLIKKSLLSLTVASVLATPLIASAGDYGTVSANVALTTDYYFRGISQTQNDGAIQGGFDWNHDSGLYAGVWGSNVAFADDVNGDVNLELDTYLGFANTFGDTGIGYDVSVLRYNYNNSPNYETTEWTAALNYSYFSASYSYSSDWFDTGDASNYFALSFDYDELPMGLALNASVGKSFGDAYDKKNGDGVRDFDYVDYKIGVSKDFAGVNFDLSYVGNNLSDSECDSYGYDSHQGNCDDRFILTVSKSIGDTSSSSESSNSDFSANVALVTDYYFRGISQTQNDGAIQGGFDWSHDSGVYVGVWSSNVAFADSDNGNVNLETDTYLGFANTIGDTGIGYDASVLRYNYNNSPNYETTEWTFALNYSYFSASYSYSSDWFDTGDSSDYISLGFDYDELPMGLGLSASVGKSFGDAYDSDNDARYVDAPVNPNAKDFDYVDYKIGVNRDFAGVNVDLSYVGNNLSDSECDAYAYDSHQGNCDDRFILSVSKGF